MELVIGLVVLVIAGVFILRPKKEAEAVVETPYKVEAQPAVADQAVGAVVTSIAPAKKPRATKAPAAKKTPAVKKAPAAKKTTTRKPKAK